MIDTFLCFFRDLPWWVWAVAFVLLLAAGFRDDRVGSVIVLSVGYGLIGSGLYGIWSSGIPQAVVVSFLAHTL